MSYLTSAGSTRTWRNLRRLVLDRDQHRCQVPTDTGALCEAHATHVDHVLPRSRGGTDDLRNLRAACRRCNLRRGNRSTSPDTAPAVPTVSHTARGWSW